MLKRLPIVMLIPIVCSFTVLFPTNSFAKYRYVRTLTCGDDAGACSPGQTPLEISWPTNCLVFYVNQRGSDQFSSSRNQQELPNEALEAVINGFKTWNDVEGSSLTYHYGGLTNENSAQWHRNEPNVNAILWRDTWPDDLPTAIALTSVSYIPSSGKVLDADIEVNSGGDYRITYGDNEPVMTDLQNTITHEAGHFLGLGHTEDPRATMFGTAQTGETSKRTLNRTDEEGVSDAYPANRGEVCDFEGVPDFYDVNSPPHQDLTILMGGCAVLPGTRPRDVTLVFVLGILLYLGRRRRRVLETQS